MKKLIAFVCALLACSSFSFGAAAEETMTGKVAAINGSTIKIEVVDLAAWAKKGAYVRAVTEKDALALRGAKVTDVQGKVITVQSAMAKQLKVGDSYKLSKGKPSAGC
ncbi:MAG: hypothetical protein HZC55_02745 [Verrucomicrobia bacterium]|nr:hypothetical protein [Verrucomicrobiota bacterium]